MTVDEELSHELVSVVDPQISVVIERIAVIARLIEFPNESQTRHQRRRIRRTAFFGHVSKYKSLYMSIGLSVGSLIVCYSIN